MRTKPGHSVLTLIAVFISLTSSGQTSAEYVHIEQDGLVSVEAEHFYRSNGWRNALYYSGNAVSPSVGSDPATSFLQYRIIFSKPGLYRFFLLGNLKKSGFLGRVKIDCVLFDQDSMVIQSNGIPIPDMYAPVWSGISGIPVFFKIAEPGTYSFLITYHSDRNISIDKFILSCSDSMVPAGTGPLETLLTDSLPREKPRVTLPPAWAFGVLYGGYTNQQQTMDALDSLLFGDFPIDAYWFDSYFWDFNEGKGPGGYINFVGDTTAYPNLEKLWTSMGERGIKTGIWIWDQINELGNESIFRHFHRNNFFINEYFNSNSWHNKYQNTLTGTIDFNNDKAVSYWKSLLKPFFDKGLDFLKLDNSSDISFCRAAFTAGQELGSDTEGRGFILAHITTTYDDRLILYPTRWTGDAKICWSQPDYPDLSVYAMGGYKENIAMVADSKRTTYEIPFLTHDAGGYDYFGSLEQSDELYTRWIQFAAMNSIMTIFSASRNPTRNHPYMYSEAVRDNFRKYTHLRMRLFPYIYSYAINTRLTGIKIVCGDGIHEQQYTLGDALLVAPVYELGSRQRTLYLPEGEWIDFENDRVYKGGRMVTVDAPLPKLPLFVRSGSVIPLRNYSRSIESGNNDTLNLHIYPSGKLTEFTLYEDDGTSNEYLEDIYSSTTFTVVKSDSETLFQIKPVKGSFHNMKPWRYYVLTFHLTGQPVKVCLDGKRLKENKILEPDHDPGWTYDHEHLHLKLFYRGLKDTGSEIKIAF